MIGPDLQGLIDEIFEVLGLTSGNGGQDSPKITNRIFEWADFNRSRFVDDEGDPVIDVDTELIADLFRDGDLALAGDGACDLLHGKHR